MPDFETAAKRIRTRAVSIESPTFDDSPQSEGPSRIGDGKEMLKKVS